MVSMLVDSALPEELKTPYTIKGLPERCTAIAPAPADPNSFLQIGKMITNLVGKQPWRTLIHLTLSIFPYSQAQLQILLLMVLLKSASQKITGFLNGVYIWTETKNAGNYFVSVHENNSVYLYTYGRYGRTNRGGFTGDGVLNFLQDEDARVYYLSELYEMDARVFRIDDADPVKTRKFVEDLWNSSKPAIQTSKMPETTRRRGHTIDGYDVTGSNCTTHSVAGIKFAGSKVFEHGYTSM